MMTRALPAKRDVALARSNGKRRKINWLDLAVLAALGLLVGYFAFRVNSVLNYKWNWSMIPQWVLRWDSEAESWVPNLLLQGFFTTLRLAAWGILIAAAIGLVMGLCRVSHNLFLRMVSRAYVELIRNIPPLVFIFIFYFFISSQIMPLLGVDALVRGASPETLAVLDVLFGSPALFTNFLSGLICLAMFEGAYVTEIVRAGIQSIDKGQWEAADGLGLTKVQVMRYVILPQAIQRIVPPLAGQLISLIKDSSIVSLISIQELTFLAIEVAVSTTRVFEIWITVAGMYFILCYGCALWFGRLEKRMAVGRH